MGRTPRALRLSKNAGSASKASRLIVLVSLRKSKGWLYCQSKLSCMDGRQCGCAITDGATDKPSRKSATRQKGGAWRSRSNHCGMQNSTHATLRAHEPYRHGPQRHTSSDKVLLSGKASLTPCATFFVGFSAPVNEKNMNLIHRYNQVKSIT